MLTMPPTVLEKYCPHIPWPKQQTFLDLECLEAFYGGGVGPGKTDALLMAAIQYVDHPRYSALILRRDFPRLSLPGSIMDRAHLWLYNTDARWNGKEKTYRFPSGAVLQFGYIDNPDDRYRYASSEYQFIGYDELTEFRLSGDASNPYEFMFSRLRRTTDNPVPLRVRSASNPGNIGHNYVKKRFLTDAAIEAMKDRVPRVFYKDAEKTRAFVPALLRDNPSINAEEYQETSLMDLSPVLRARLMNGDWSVREYAKFDAEWFRDFKIHGDLISFIDKSGKLICERSETKAYRFLTADTAGTTEDIARESKGRRQPSWSVIACWDAAKSDGRTLLALRDVWRKRTDINGILDGFHGMTSLWNPKNVFCENAHFGPAVKALLNKPRDGRPRIPVTLVSTQIKSKGAKEASGKLQRAVPFINKMSAGEVFLPFGDASWRLDYESELLSWTGDADETADQIDVSSYAAKYCDVTGAGLAGRFTVYRGT